MKRVGNLYEKMISREMIEKAYTGVMKDKPGKSRPGSNTFLISTNKDYYIHSVGELLYKREFKPAKPREAIRYDKGSGKIRHIQAPRIYPDQFVHWSIILQLQPIFMRGMDDWCCGSIKGRGTKYAKDFIEKTLDNSLNDRRKIPIEREYKYCLKMDIKKFFDNIDREILVKKLNRVIKDKEMIKICTDIIYSTKGPGIPLGYYTSQWFANFYLQSFDHHLREKLMPKYNTHIYVRYMDDMIILGSNKRKLINLMKEISNYLKEELHLSLKETSSVFSIADNPIDFIGYKFSYGKTTVRKKILYNMRKANIRLHSGKFSHSKLRSSEAYISYIKSTDIKTYAKNNLKGNLALEFHKLKQYNKEYMEEYLSSPKYIKYNTIKEKIDDIKKNDKDPGHVLVRHYNKTDDQRIVSRCSFVFPDEEEYNKKNNKPKKKKKKYKKSYFDRQ